MLEIRWHGRGGQGAKTAAMLLAQTAMKAGFEIQAFPEYGPERSGAPITAYTRISESPIRIHSGISHPGAVVVLDPGLIDVVDITAGLAEEDGLLLVNSSKAPEQLQEKLNQDIARLATVDATAIAREETESAVPNMPMLGAFIQIEKIVSLEDLIEIVKRPFPAKAICRALQNIKAVGVMDRSDTFSSRGGPLYSEITSALYENKQFMPVADYIFGLGGREIDPQMIETIFNQLLHIMKTQRVEQPVNYIGVRE